MRYSIKIITFIIAFSILFLCSSCKETYTSKLWNDNYYKEVFYYFLISKDGQFVVFLNDDFHYVFNDSSRKIQKLLLWKNSKKLYINTNETTLKISANNQVQGIAVIDIDKDNVDFEDLSIINNLGFINKGEKFTIKFPLYGQRYQAKSNITDFTPRLSTPYNIRIYRNLTSGQKIAKASLSPLTLVVDAIMISGKILTFPFTD